MGRQFERLIYTKDETQPMAPEPTDPQDADDSQAAGYAASCETTLYKELAAGKDANIEQVQDDGD